MNDTRVLLGAAVVFHFLLMLAGFGTLAYWISALDHRVILLEQRSETAPIVAPQPARPAPSLPQQFR